MQRTGNRRRARLPQTVPATARGAWGDLVARKAEALIDAAANARGQEAAQEVHDALEELADLPQQVLAHAGSSRSRAGQTLGPSTQPWPPLTATPWMTTAPKKAALAAAAVPQRVSARGGSA